MSVQRQRSFAVSLLTTSLLVMLMGVGGGWGAAYGQSGSGPVPAPIQIGPGTGAEGEPPAGGAPARNEAIAGESGEAPVVNAPAVSAPLRNEAVAGDAGEVAVIAPAAGDGLGSRLDNSGADSAVQWQLLLVGVVLFATGALLFVRTRKLR